MHGEYSHVSPLLTLVLLALYGLYAGQQFYWVRQATGKALPWRVHAALWSPSVVFIMCGIAHNTQLLPQTAGWYAFRQWWYMGLIIATVLLITSQAAKIMVHHLYKD